MGQISPKWKNVHFLTINFWGVHEIFLNICKNLEGYVTHVDEIYLTLGKSISWPLSSFKAPIKLFDYSQIFAIDILIT